MSSGITPTYDWALRNAHIKSDFVRETIAEFLGTLLLLFFVVGAGLQQLIHPDSHLVPVLGTVLGLMVCILIFGGISGAHINPAVSIGLAVAGHLNWAKVPLYITAQILGGYLGSLLSYALYKDHIRNKIADTCGVDVSIPDCDKQIGGIIMASFSPAGNGTSIGVGIVTEIILTAILLMAVMSVIDKGNMKIPPYLVAFLLALTVAALAMAHNAVTGTMLNPARDFTPRLAALTLGWDRELCFQNKNFSGTVQEWWVVGIFAPPIGAVIGVLLYNFLVGAQLTNHPNELQDMPMTYANGGAGEKLENGLAPRFIPRSGPPPNQMAYAPNQMAYNGQQHPNQMQYTGPPPPVNGHFNPSYIREDDRRRQY